MRELVGAFVDLAVGQPDVAEDDGFLAGRPAHGVLEEVLEPLVLGEVAVGGVPLVELLALLLGHQVQVGDALCGAAEELAEDLAYDVEYAGDRPVLEQVARVGHGPLEVAVRCHVPDDHQERGGRQFGQVHVAVGEDEQRVEQAAAQHVVAGDVGVVVAYGFVELPYGLVAGEPGLFGVVDDDRQDRCLPCGGGRRGVDERGHRPVSVAVGAHDGVECGQRVRGATGTAAFA